MSSPSACAKAGRSLPCHDIFAVVKVYLKRWGVRRSDARGRGGFADGNYE